jgi:hypothetical protein
MTEAKNYAPIVRKLIVCAELHRQRLRQLTIFPLIARIVRTNVNVAQTVVTIPADAYAGIAVSSPAYARAATAVNTHVSVL